MKSLKIVFILFLLSFTSCKSQETISINYEARTRGYHHKVELNNNALIITKNSDVKSIELSENQFEIVQKLLSEINLSEIKNNTSTDNFAVDASVPIEMIISFKNKEYIYNFDSNKLPKKIKELMLSIENFTKKE